MINKQFQNFFSAMLGVTKNKFAYFSKILFAWSSLFPEKII